MLLGLWTLQIGISFGWGETGAVAGLFWKFLVYCDKVMKIITKSIFSTSIEDTFYNFNVAWLN